MTPEAMNRAIAEHLGLPLTVRRWRFVHDGLLKDGFISHDDAEFHAYGMSRVYGGRITAPEPYEDDAVIPNYSDDLNVMHEAFLALGDARSTYLMWVRDLYPLCPIEAPASIRAEAFLRAVRKWKEVE